jgi:hypothetical protein
LTFYISISNYNTVEVKNSYLLWTMFLQNNTNIKAYTFSSFFIRQTFTLNATEIIHVTSFTIWSHKNHKLAWENVPTKFHKNRLLSTWSEKDFIQKVNMTLTFNLMALKSTGHENVHDKFNKPLIQVFLNLPYKIQFIATLTFDVRINRGQLLNQLGSAIDYEQCSYQFSYY